MTIEELQTQLNTALAEIEELKFRIASLVAELQRTKEAVRIAEAAQ